MGKVEGTEEHANMLFSAWGGQNGNTKISNK